MKDGATSRVVVMSKAEVMKVKAVSKTASFSDSPWTNWEDRMWLKTAIHQLEKWVPTSAEYRREQLRAAVEADNLRTPRTAASVRADREPIDVTDAEIVEDEPNPMHYDADEIEEGS
jgi:recombination protein RecT